MNTFLASVIVILLALVVLFFSFDPVFAQAVAAAAAAPACVPKPNGLDLCPIIPVINGLIVTVAGILSASVPAIVFYLVKWLRNHGIAVTQAGQKLISDRISATIQNGLKYATAEVDEQVNKITVPVPNEQVRKAANYAIAQSPDLLKKAGVDVTTEKGQEALVRRITAESMPVPAAQTPQLDVHVDAATKT